MRTVLLLLALAGCAGSPAGSNGVAQNAPPSGPPLSNEARIMLDAAEGPFQVPGTVAARLGQEVRIGDVHVRPVAVLEDSRCPIDVDCVWAGRIRVRVAVRGAGEPVMELDRPVPVPGGERLILVAVAPPRWSRPPQGVDPNAPQRFAFRLTGMD